MLFGSPRHHKKALNLLQGEEHRRVWEEDEDDKKKKEKKTRGGLEVDGGRERKETIV